MFYDEGVNPMAINLIRAATLPNENHAGFNNLMCNYVLPIPPPACGGAPYRNESMYALISSKSGETRTNKQVMLVLRVFITNSYLTNRHVYKQGLCFFFNTKSNEFSRTFQAQKFHFQGVVHWHHFVFV